MLLPPKIYGNPWTHSPAGMGRAAGVYMQAGTFVKKTEYSKEKKLKLYNRQTMCDPRGSQLPTINWTTLRALGFTASEHVSTNWTTEKEADKDNGSVVCLLSSSASFSNYNFPRIRAYALHKRVFRRSSKRSKGPFAEVPLTEAENKNEVGISLCVLAIIMIRRSIHDDLFGSRHLRLLITFCVNVYVYGR